MKKVLLFSLFLSLAASPLFAADGEAASENSYGVLSILPPLLAIVLAVATRQVLVALFLGIWLGTTFLNAFNPGAGFLRLLDHYLINALADPDHAAIILFSMTLGGIVRIIAQTGGMHALLSSLSSLARSVRLTQLATYLMGIFIFFDDYANTLLVGNTMRPFTDRLKISREKLAYIVDSTAAPITSIAPVSTWIGYEIGLLGAAFADLDLEAHPFSVFIDSIPYRFYGILALLFVFFTIILKKEFSLMLKAEKRAQREGKVLADNATPLIDTDGSEAAECSIKNPHWLDAVIPIAVVILTTLFGLYFSGIGALEESAAGENGHSLRAVIAEANSYHVLMWAAFSGAFIALLLSLRTLTLQKAFDAFLAGAKSMVLAMIVLVLAWSIGAVCKDLGTASFCVAITSDAIEPALLPLVIFALAAAISFATGTSWGTMAILVPIAVPIAWKLSASGTTSDAVFLGSIAGVLSGATFGDHCSPISDTTVMSSMASACDHIDHVKTQLPYAATVGVVSMAAGYLPAGFGMSPWIGLACGAGVLFALLYWYGKSPDSPH